MTNKIFKQFIGTREDFEAKLETYTSEERLQLAESIVFIHQNPKYVDASTKTDSTYTGWIYANDFFYSAEKTVGLTAQAVADLVSGKSACTVTVEDDKLIFTPVTTEEITVTSNVGNITKDTTFPAGTSLESILQQLLCKEAWNAAAPKQTNSFTASVTAPTVTLSPSDTVEVGTNVTLSAYTAKASSASQSVSVATMSYGYRDGSATATWNKTATSYKETLSPTEESDSTVKLTAAKTAGFSSYSDASASGTASALPTLAAQSLVADAGTNSIKLTQTGSTWDAETTVTEKSLYVCTNLGHVTKSATDESDNVVSVSGTWAGDSTKQASNNASASVTGKYYAFITSLAGDIDDTVTPAEIRTGNIKKAFLENSGSTTLYDANTTFVVPANKYTTFIAIPSTYELTSITDKMGNSYKEKWELTTYTITDFTIGGSATTSYTLYKYYNSGTDVVEQKNLVITKK